MAINIYGRPYFVALTLVCAVTQTLSAQTPAPLPGAQNQPSPPAYVTRGDAAESRYDIHGLELERFYGRLASQLEKDAPDLRPRLEAPAPVPYGYQILPALNNPAPSTPRTRV